MCRDPSLSAQGDGGRPFPFASLRVRVTGWGVIYPPTRHSCPYSLFPSPFVILSEAKNLIDETTLRQLRFCEHPHRRLRIVQGLRYNR